MVEKQAVEIQIVEKPRSTSGRNFWAGMLFGLCMVYILMPEKVEQFLQHQRWSNVMQWLTQVKFWRGQGETSSAPPEVISLRRAIIAQESNGQSHLFNASGSGAMGLAQVMPENVAQWSWEALGREVTPQEFLAQPELQLKIIDHKLTEYWQQALEQAQGNEAEAVQRVAAWWYCGDPGLYQDTKPQFYNGDRYPSIAEYSQTVLERFRAETSYRF